jgi:uncharacterized membrane protein
MVLELKIPETVSFTALKAILPKFLSYFLSFVYVGIYWNNHHHMLSTIKKVSGMALWANLHLLFWLSIVPFVTGWLGENFFSSLALSCYGLVLLMSAFAYIILQQTLVKIEGKSGTLAQAVKKDWKGKLSLLLYIIAILIGYFIPEIALAIYVLVAIIWFVPDTRIEKKKSAV